MPLGEQLHMEHHEWVDSGTSSSIGTNVPEVLIKSHYFQHYRKGTLTFRVAVKFLSSDDPGASGTILCPHFQGVWSHHLPVLFLLCVLL